MKKQKNICLLEKNSIFADKISVRDVAQPGSALRSGRRGRKFESCHPDNVKVPWPRG